MTHVLMLDALVAVGLAVVAALAVLAGRWGK